MDGKPWLVPARRQCLAEREAAGDRRTRPREARPGGIGCERLRTEPGADAGDQLRQRSALGRVVHAEYGAEKALRRNPGGALDQLSDGRLELVARLLRPVRGVAAA